MIEGTQKEVSLLNIEIRRKQVGFHWQFDQATPARLTKPGEWVGPSLRSFNSR
jgi:hypothetical protein